VEGDAATLVHRSHTLDGDAEDPTRALGGPLEIDELDAVRGQDGSEGIANAPQIDSCFGLVLCVLTHAPKKKSRFPNWESGSRIPLVVGRTLPEGGALRKGRPGSARRVSAAASMYMNSKPNLAALQTDPAR